MSTTHTYTYCALVAWTRDVFIRIDYRVYRSPQTFIFPIIAKQKKKTKNLCPEKALELFCGLLRSLLKRSSG